MTCHLRTALVVALACVACAPAAHAAPVGVEGLLWQLDGSRQKGQFFDTLGEDCLSSAVVDWHGLRHADPLGVSMGHQALVATGTVDGVAHTGSLHETATALELGRNVPPENKVLELRDLGIELAGTRAYLTGRLVLADSGLSSAKRVRLALIAHPKFSAGPALDTKKREIPNSFLMAMQGRATVLPGLIAGLNRIRCHKPTGVLRPRPFRRGSLFADVTVQIQPDRGLATAGSVNLIGGAQLANDEDVAVQLAPVAPAVSGRVQRRPAFVYALPPGTRVPIACNFGLECLPQAGAQIPMPGGFTVAYGDRTATVDSLQAFYVAGPPGRTASIGLTGSLNGQPMTIADADQDGAPASAGFLDALGQALGLHFRVGMFTVVTNFTDSAPF